MKKTIIISMVTLIFALSCKNEEPLKVNMEIQPPVAEKIEKHLEKHGDVRIDNYYWLNDRENPEVIEYLNKENEYYQQSTAHTKDFQKNLYDEMKARIKEDDESVPYKFNGYWYISKYKKGKEYEILSRKKETLDAKEELMLDVNVLAKGYEYYDLGDSKVSENNQILAYG